ncbi:MAG: serine hydrolase, partial [Phycisphaerae bacterium]|nr:serine hydrolase [Phycisphaerae bacterium]
GTWDRVWHPKEGAPYEFMHGSQGLGSTPMDYARFLALWLDRGMAGTKRLLSEDAVSRGLTPVSLADMNTGFRGTKVYYGHQWMLYLSERESISLDSSIA